VQAMRVPFLNELLQQLIEDADPSQQNPNRPTKNSQMEHDGLQPISELGPHIFRDLYSHGQLPPSGGSLDNALNRKTDAIILSSDQKKLIKQAIDKPDLLALKGILGPKVPNVRTMKVSSPLTCNHV